MENRSSFWRTCLLAVPFLSLVLSSGGLAQEPPSKETEAKDLSATPMRTLDARVSFPSPKWNSTEQKVSGRAIVILFDGTATPLKAIGKAAPAGTVQMTPARDGEWKWTRSNSLAFYPTSGWLPPGNYRFKIAPEALSEDCQLADKSGLDRSWDAPNLTARFTDRSYYIDPSTPTLQQLVTTVSFSLPVAIEEIQRHLSVNSLSGIDIFQEGSQPQVIADPKDPRTFYLRSPLMTPGEKEDLVSFKLREGLVSKVGGTPTKEKLESKLTAYSKYSNFTIKSVGTMLRKTSEGEPEQAIVVALSMPADTGALTESIEAWKLPPAPKDKYGRTKKWRKETVSDEVLAEAEQLPFTLVTDPDAAPLQQAMALRVEQQPSAQIFVRVRKDTAGPGGFITAEDFRGVTTLPDIPKEVSLLGEGGLLAMQGERKITVQSRGLDHLRYTVARVQTDQINHLVSQSNGNFESPYFRGNFGLESVSDYEQSVQPIVKKGEYGRNYSSFDFSPLLKAAQPGVKPQHGLFHLTVQGVRPRTAEDRAAPEGSPDKDWLPIGNSRSRSNSSSRSSTNYPTGDRPTDQRFILVTDLGLIMKEAADGQRFVYVQSFSQLGPIEGVEISVLARNGTILKNATTNANGRAELPSLRGLLKEKQPVALIARKGDDLAFVPWAKYDRHLDVSRFDVGGVNYSEKSALSASMFTERGIYRPGEPIHIGGIVRQRDWQGDLTGLPLELVVRDAKHEVSGRYPLKLASGGVFSQTVPTEESAPTGPWRISLERPKPEGSQHRGPTYLGRTTVRVEEFQPDRLKVKAKFNPEAGNGWRSPEGLAVDVQLDTLFGIPAANRRVASKLFLKPVTPSFSKWPGWQFGISDNRWHDTKEITLTDVKTDDQGKATIALNLDAHTAPMLRARVELEGFEADGGRGVRTELSTLVSRQSYLIGHKADRSLRYLTDREPVSVGIVAIGSDSKPVAVPALTRVLIQTKHVSVLTKQKNGSLAYESQERDQTLESVAIALPAEEQPLPLPLDKPGRFRYEFRNATGQALSSITFFVSGKGDATKDLERSGELAIEFPDKKWLPGEELEFTLTTPFTGAGLITIERDTVLAEMWFECDTKTSVQKIRLPKNLEGGTYLHVVMARDLNSPDVFLNPLASGIMPIPAARADREMAVSLEAPERVRPGERLSISYTAPKDGHVLIWAVDEGIHLVSKYQAPDPLAKLLPDAALEVQTYQLMDVLLPEFSLLRKALAIGGGGGGGEAASIPELQLGLNPFKRRRDPPVVFWSGFVPCGPEKKEVFYQVPEYFAGRLKIMAVAVAPDSIGVGKHDTIVKGDFVLTATTPLFAVPGDEFTASVTIANQLEGDAVTDQVMVKAELEGGVEIIKAADEKQVIPVGKEVTLQYRCRATAQLGNAELKFTASSGTSRQASSSSFSVRPGVARAAKIQSGWFRNGSHDVPVTHPMFAEFSEREAIVSTTPLGLAHGLSAYLKEYPHGCTEQITSRAFPWLVLKDDANFGIDKAEAEKAIAITMNQLSQRQGSNGGFGYWASSDPSGFDYLTVYVGHFLTECQSSGMHVPARLYQSTMRRLRYMASAKVSTPHKSLGRTYYWSTRWQAEMQAAAIYLLTRNEEVTTNYAIKLQDFMESKVPKDLWHRDSTAAWLAATWRLLKKESAAKPLIKSHRAALKKPLPKNWEHQHYYYTSKLTREATAFTILCRHFPEIAKKLTYDEMKPLTEMIEQADFHTLSAAWSVQALKAYAELAESNGVTVGIATVNNDEVNVLKEPASGQVRVKVPEGMTRFFFGPDSPEGLGAWYQTIEKGFAKNLPEEPSSKHIEIKRELVDADDKPVTQSKLGETLFAKITIRNVTKTKLPNLAITEMLPGGFELAPPGEPHSLRPGLRSRQGTDYIDVREDRALIYLGLGAEKSLTLKYALRPTCAGSFVVPPPYAEDMYEAKVRANGAAGKIIILPRD